MKRISRRELLRNAGLLALGTFSSISCSVKPRPGSKAVEYEFFRNVTARLTYGGQTLLLDPMLSPKGALPSFAGISPNPTVELPTSPAAIIRDIDAVIVTHMHSDHFDPAAGELLDKSLPIITPRNSARVNPADPSTLASFKTQLEEYGFSDVMEIASEESESLSFRNLTFRQVWARHGKGVVGDLIGDVNGIIVTADGMPTIYWTSDTILDEAGEIEGILQRFKPDIVIANTGGPVIEAVSPELLLMDAAQGIELIKLANRYNPKVQVVAIHMESLDHCFSTRQDLLKLVNTLPAELQQRVFIPEDGEHITLG